MTKIPLIASLVLCASLTCAPAQDVFTPNSKEAKGAAFLTKIRLADPNYQVILMACLKDRELNLLLGRNLKEDEIPILLRGLASQLSAQFPGEDLTVIAFRPVVPLREAGIARFEAQRGTISFFKP